MHQPEYGKNHRYYIDIIPIHLAPKHFDFDEIRRLYLDDALSAAEIAKRYDSVKPVILSILHRMGIQLGKGARPLNDPQHYRAKNPPYGYSVKNKKLDLCKAEIRVCRAIVEMMGRQNMSGWHTAKELVRRGTKNRKGRPQWDQNTVKLIFERWKHKV